MSGAAAGSRSTLRLAASLVLPFGYFFFTRVPSARQKLGWLFSFVLPVLGLAAAAHGSAAGLVPAALMIVAIYTAYEFGYLANDSVAVRREASPTQRLAPYTRDWIAARLGQALLARAAFGAALLLLLVRLDPTHALLAVLGWLAIWPLFALYNLARGRAGIVLYLLLVGLRFSLPVLVVARPDGATPAWPLLWLLFAVPTTFEAAWKPRYGLGWLRSPFGSEHRFRVLWYLLLTSATASAAWLTQRDDARLLAAASAYYLVIRLTAACVRGGAPPSRRDPLRD